LIPTLETERLRLRVQTMQDWPAYASLMMSDRAVHMEGPHTMAEAWGLFCHDLAQWPLLGCGALMIDDRETGECLGQVGINHGPLFPEHELGWMVYPGAEGRGARSPSSSWIGVGRPMPFSSVMKGLGSSSSTLAIFLTSHSPVATSMAAATGGTPAV
jgi:hypothetical protein